MKKVAVIFVLLAVKSWAGGMVYMVPEVVVGSSQSVAHDLSSKQSSFNQNKAVLIAKIDAVQVKVNGNNNASDLEQLSAELNDLQNEYDALNTNFTKEYNDVKNNYYVCAVEAAKELQVKNKYDYVFNNSSIVAASPKNDISKQVSLLADKIYNEKYK